MKNATRLAVAAALAGIITIVPARANIAQPYAGEKATENGGPVSKYGVDVPVAYYELSFKLSKRTTGFTPPVQSRAYAYMGLALYEALVSGMPQHKSIAGQLAGIGDLPQAKGSSYHWPLVASAALAEVMRGLWGGATNAAAANIADIDALESNFESEFADVRPGLLQRSAVFGRSVGAAVFETSKDDGGHEGYNGNFPAYTPPVGPGRAVSS